MRLSQGQLRNNLVAMLDHIGLNSRIGVSSNLELWSTSNHLVHFTSGLRYPVLVNGKNMGSHQ
jgi:hypothetical protein